MHSQQVSLGQDLESSGCLDTQGVVPNACPTPECLSASLGTGLEQTLESCFSFSTCCVYQAWEPVLNQHGST